MAGRLRREQPAGPLLVCGDPSGVVERAAGEGERAVVCWHRVARPGLGGATPWPPDGAVAGAVVRLPKSREALRMALHAVAGRVPVGGRVWVYGANDEGIKSIEPILEECLEKLRAVESARHARVWRGLRRETRPGPRSARTDWEEACTLELPGDGTVTLRSYPGLFAKGALDPATRLLLETLPRPKADARILDFACGTGVIGRALRERRSPLAVTGIDADALAVEAAAHNVAGAVVLVGRGLDGLPDKARFDWIVSNPPIHEGRARDLSVLEALCRDAPARLARRGALWIVAQRTIAVARFFERGPLVAALVAETASFRVWRAAAGPREGRA